MDSWNKPLLLNPNEGYLYLTINSGDDSSFIVPTMGRLNDQYNTYNWKITWGDGSVENISGEGYNYSGINHIYPKANTLYTLRIEPINASEKGWLRAFSFYNRTYGNLPNKAKVVDIKANLTEHALRTSETDSFVGFCMFEELVNVTSLANVKLPQNITTVGDHFYRAMFIYNVGLTTLGNNIKLPQKLSKAGIYFCYNTFHDGINIKTGVRSFFGNNVCSNEIIDKENAYTTTFRNCSSLIENLATIPQIANTFPNTRKNTFLNCPSELTASLHENWK